MMKEPVQGVTGSSALASPAVVVVLVLMLGASFYLWREGYMHPRTAYVTMTVLVIALIALSAYIYFNPT